MPDPFGLQPYLYDNIPLSQHLGIRVDHADPELVRLIAPLEPNINHRKTGFGGSISAIAILAGWSLLWCRLRGRTGGHDIVIHKNSMEFVAPVMSEFFAVCLQPPADEWTRFEEMFDQRGRARIDLSVEVRSGETLNATFSGRYVALRSE
jgi:thioesterase domain-containing protein